MKKYLVSIRCTSRRQFEIEATSEKEAEELALNKFICPDFGGKVDEVELLKEDNK